MTVKDIYTFLDQRFPFSSAMSIDNVGLLIGDSDSEVTKVLVCLDLTSLSLEKAINIGAELIVTHHPVIFEALSEITADSLVYKAIKNNISVISAHTNLDNGVGGVNDCLAEVLGLENIKKVDTGEELIIRKGALASPLSPEAFGKFLKEKLNITPRFNLGGKNIKNILVCGGSGGSHINSLISENCDALVTADVKYHLFLDAAEKEITLFDCGHFHTENLVVKPLTQLLSSAFENIEFTCFEDSLVTEV